MRGACTAAKTALPLPGAPCESSPNAVSPCGCAVQLELAPPAHFGNGNGSGAAAVAAASQVVLLGGQVAAPSQASARVQA